MLPKIFIVLILLLIIGSLFSAVFFLIKDDGRSERTVKALSYRIGLSVALFVLLLLGYVTGILEPHGVYPPPPASQAAPETGAQTPPAAPAPAQSQ